jgi:hypothetical protein
MKIEIPTLKENVATQVFAALVATAPRLSINGNLGNKATSEEMEERTNKLAASAWRHAEIFMRHRPTQ